MEHSDKPGDFSVSRRDFLKSAGVGSLAATVAGATDLAAQGAGARVREVRVIRRAVRPVSFRAFGDHVCCPPIQTNPGYLV